MSSDAPLSDAAKALHDFMLDDRIETRFITDSQVDPSVASVFSEVFEERQRRLEDSAQEARKIYYDYLSTGKPFGLFLRPFEPEAYEYEAQAIEGDTEERKIYRFRGTQSVERHLYSSLQERIPFIAIVSPVDILVRGPIPRISGGGAEEWKSWVERLATEAAIIVFHCSALSLGVSVELDLLRRCNRKDSTLVVLEDPGLSDNPEPKLIFERSWPGVVGSGHRGDLSKIAKVTHYEVPQKDHPALADFSRLAYEREIDWSRLEKSPFLGDLLMAALRQDNDDPTKLPDTTWLPPDIKLVVLSERARVLRLKGYLERAAAAAADALSIAQQLGDQENIAAIHVSVGIIALEMGRLSVALGAFHDSGVMFHNLGDKDGEATAAAWAGRVLIKAGEPDAAVHIFLTALQLSMDIEAYDDMASILQQMAPLLDKISPDLRRHPGVQVAADLIKQLEINKGGKQDSPRNDRRVLRWLRRNT
jgi:tetratricopeptide (TPR) repeat protein